jgi:hypothetical protein
MEEYNRPRRGPGNNAASKHFNTDFTEKKLKPQSFAEKRAVRDMDDVLWVFSK